MASGDFIIKTDGSTAAVPHGGSIDALWDSTEIDQSTLSYSAGKITLPVGIYLIMYSQYFQTTNTTSNTRVEINGEIHNNLGLLGGLGQGYIRKTSGDQECVVKGQMIYEVSSGTEDVFVKFFRTDSSIAGSVDRAPNSGGFMILELDAADNFGLYETSTQEQNTGTNVKTLNANNIIRQDSTFAISSGVMTLPSTGYYVVTYSMDVSHTSTSAREEAIGYLSRNGTASPITGTYSYCYMRGNESTQEGALTWIGVIQATANDTIQLRYHSPSSATITVPIGASFQAWELPVGADKCIMEATTGNYNADAIFTWNTLPTIDVNSFTASASTQNIDVDQNDYVLSFATLSQNVPDTPQRAVPYVRFAVEGDVKNYAVADAYHRNTAGIGGIAINASSILSVPSGGSVTVTTLPKAASGTLTNDSAQFACISLSSIYGAYIYSPSISSSSVGTIIDGNPATLTGSAFEAVQNSGKVELWSDLSGTTKVLQTITSWSDTSIDITVVTGALPDGLLYFVVTTDSGKISNTLQVSLGFNAYDIFIDNLAPDHGWTMDNTYADNMGSQGTNDCNSSQVGIVGFDPTPLCRSSSYSLKFSSTDAKSEVPDSVYTNVTTLHSARDIGGWIMVDKIQEAPAGIYEEGGGVNNLYFILGFGNILLANVADSNSSPTVKEQAFSDIKLVPNRPYHIHMHYESATFGGVLEMYIDGIKQSVVTGPILHTQMSTHSGDWSFGKPDGSLDTGGTDIQYPSATNMFLSHWYTFSALGSSPLSATNIRTDLFEAGALSSVTISQDTVVNMQADFESYNATTRPNYPGAFLVYEPSDSADLTLTATNMVFDEFISMHIQWKGPGTLTLINVGTSNIDASICSALEGGTIVVVNAVPIDFNVKDISDNALIGGARVRVVAEAGGNLTAGDAILSGVTDSNGDISGTLLYTNDQPIKAVFRSGSAPKYYQQQLFSGTITENGLAQTILLVEDQ